MPSTKEKILSNKEDVKKLWRRIRSRDFSGHTGTVLKNSWYQFLTNLATKVGSFIFTVILARMLLPSLFGEYNLALSIILIFAAFSDLGMSDTIIRFVSKKIGENDKEKADAYLKYLTKIKIFLTLIVPIILVLTAGLISSAYPNESIYLALIAGALYLLFVGFIALFQAILQAHNIFKPLFYRETIFQIVRIIGIPILTIYLLKLSLGDSLILFWIVGFLAFTYLLSGLSLLFYKDINIFSILKKRSLLSLAERKEANRFIIFISATIFSGVFFGYIDTIILGIFVHSQYLGYYRAAFNLLGAIAPLITLSAALLPTFTKLGKEDLELLFKRSYKFTLFLSVLISLILFLFANFIIFIIYGTQYSLAANILRIFAIILATFPLSAIYSVYFESIGKPELATKSLIWSTVLNIALNLAFVAYLIRYGELWATYGSAIATVLSRVFYMVALSVSKKRLPS